MFCPKCGAEYREGFSICADCSIPLSKELPSQPEPVFVKPVTVYRTTDAAFIAFAESVLRNEGIKYFIKGEGLQELFAAGRLGTGYNPVIGPIEIEVDERDSERAKQLLNSVEQGVYEESDTSIEDSHSENKENAPVGNTKRKAKDIAIGFVIGALLVASIVLYLHPEYRQKHFSGVMKSDWNKDSKHDVFYKYENNVLVASEEDRNFDGKIDAWYSYKDGIVDQGRSDDDFDGKPETMLFCKYGNICRREIDTNFDEKPEIVEGYTDGVLSEMSWYHESSHSLWKKAYFVNGIMREEHIDRDYDGKFDLRIIYSSSERPIRTEPFR